MKQIDFSLDTQQAHHMQRLQAELQNKHAKYHIVTYGCQMNSNDSEKLAGMLTQMGMEATAQREEADLVLLNTCCVREHAENKVYGNVGALSKLKQSRPQMRIAICGCMMQEPKAADKIAARFPDVDLIFGTYAMAHFPEMLDSVLLQNQRVIQVAEEEPTVVENIPQLRSSGISAWVSIMYGCNNFCSYCIVPYVRGRERSRTVDSILQEIHTLENNGVREITLLGQNVNSYGAGSDTDFAALLQCIQNECEGIARVRFMTSHPKDLSHRLLDTMAACNKVCAQLHLPVQSGSNEILRQMNRRYTVEEYAALVAYARRVMPNIGLSTDLIVGFPGETEEDFRATLSLVRTIRYDSLYAFKYSRRTGTPAAAMQQQVDTSTKERRLAELIATQKTISDEIANGYLGRIELILVEAKSPRHARQMTGRTASGHTVAFDCEETKIGMVLPVKITTQNANTLRGMLVEDSTIHA